MRKLVALVALMLMLVKTGAACEVSAAVAGSAADCCANSCQHGSATSAEHCCKTVDAGTGLSLKSTLPHGALSLPMLSSSLAIFEARLSPYPAAHCAPVLITASPPERLYSLQI